MSRKRVLIVGFFPDPNKNPVTQAGELAKVLKQNGYEVCTVSKHRNKYLRIVDIILYMLLRTSRYDVAVVQFYSGNSFIWQYFAGNIAKFLGKKLVFTVHGGSVPDRIKALPKRYLPLLKKADVITCPSPFIISKLKEFGIDAQLVENSIPLEHYTFTSKTIIRPRIFWMRSFASIYNPAMAVRVVKELKKDFPDVKLYMGGPDQGSLEEIKILIEKEQVTGNIEILGFVDMKMKRKYSEEADVYICTNKVDNAPVTFLEMWAMGLPIISANVGGIPYLVKDGEDAILVADDDHIAMAARIREVVSNKTLSGQLIRNGKERVKRYSEQEVYNKWDKLLTIL